MKYSLKFGTKSYFFFILLALIFTACPGIAGEVKPSSVIYLASTGNNGSNLPNPSAEYEAALREAMEALFNNLQSILNDTSLNTEEKKQKTLELIKAFRWGPEDKNYFWVNDLKGNMILEPFIAFYEGRNFLDYTDVNGKSVFVEIINICKKYGEGFIEYMWTEGKYVRGKSYPKIAMVKLLKSWGWIIGTGIIFDTIEPMDIHPGHSPIDDTGPASGI
ncbi:MAG: cache domain-containing protein [Deltaproteobacteria bacterium]|nr:cache domain-containing protein [Deltaproteobacteria bacterium]